MKDSSMKYLRGNFSFFKDTNQTCAPLFCKGEFFPDNLPMNLCINVKRNKQLKYLDLPKYRKTRDFLAEICLKGWELCSIEPVPEIEVDTILGHFLAAVFVGKELNSTPLRRYVNCPEKLKNKYSQNVTLFAGRNLVTISF